MDEATKQVFLEFSREVNRIFQDNLRSMVAYGSAVYDDLHVGYSDLDFFAVVNCDITQCHFNTLLEYRQTLRADANPLYGMLEGEFIPIDLLGVREGKNVAYWGTSGERMKNRYDLSGFSMRGLLDSGIVIFGEDIRAAIPYPTDEEMIKQVLRLIDTVRKYAVTTNEAVHSADWLFLICQSLYWLMTGGTACKTDAAGWAKENIHEDWCKELDKAIQVRLDPVIAETDTNKQWLAALGGTIQAACDTLAVKAMKAG